MYRCESWTVKKAESRRIDGFELWCWRRLLRVPWAARRSNQSILKEISPGISLEGLMLKLKLQYFGHLMWRVDSLEKPWCWEGLGSGEEGDDRGWDGWMASRTRWTWVWVNSGRWWCTGRPGVLQFLGLQRVGQDWATELNCPVFPAPFIEESVFAPLYILASFVKNKAWVYFCAFYLVPLVCISVLCQYHTVSTIHDCSFVVQSEVRKIDSSSSIFLSQDCLGYSGSFVFPYELWNFLF